MAEVFFVWSGLDEGDLDGDGSGFGFDAFDGVGDQVHEDLVDEGGVYGDGRHLGVGVDDEGDAFFLADFFHELGAVLGEFVDVGEFEFELEFASEGEHVHRERGDAVEVAAEDSPSVSCDGEVAFVESDFDDIGAAFEALEDIFDGV